MRRLATLAVVGLLLLGLTQDAQALPWRIIQLTNDSHDDRDPQVRGSSVVWSGSDGHDREIFLFDGSSITQITDNEHDDFSPQISGSDVVWYGRPAKTVFLYDGSAVRGLVTNGTKTYARHAAGQPEPADSTQLDTFVSHFGR